MSERRIRRFGSFRFTYGNTMIMNLNHPLLKLLPSNIDQHHHSLREGRDRCKLNIDAVTPHYCCQLMCNNKQLTNKFIYSLTNYPT